MKGIKLVDVDLAAVLEKVETNILLTVLFVTEPFKALLAVCSSTIFWKIILQLL